MMSMQRLDLPEPCVPQTKSVGNEPTAFMKLAFIGVAKNQPRMGRMTSGVFTCGRYRNTVLAISRKVSSSVARRRRACRASPARDVDDGRRREEAVLADGASRGRARRGARPSCSRRACSSRGDAAPGDARARAGVPGRCCRCPSTGGRPRAAGESGRASSGTTSAAAQRSAPSCPLSVFASPRMSSPSSVTTRIVGLMVNDETTFDSPRAVTQ
jgi:hypothetical protein